MPTLFDTITRLAGRSPAAPAEAKRSATGPLVALQWQGQPVWSPRDYSAFSREGFIQNPVVHRSVRMIAEAAASVPLLLFDGADELTDHPLQSLLARPNPVQSGNEFLETCYGYLLVAGNAFIEAVPLGAEVRELYPLRPDRMTVIAGADGWPEGHEYTVAGRKVRFPDRLDNGVRPILHLQTFHPLNDHYGLSPIEAAAQAIDIYNAACAWNKSLLDNAARPSGALVYSNGGGLDPAQFERLKSELEDAYQGSRNAGRPLLLEGGLDWKAMGLSPTDMDFIEAKNSAARDIALAFGVPPMLLGIPGDNTYSNYLEANRTFWRQSVLPLVTRTLDALSAWLAPAFGDRLRLRPDIDAIEALSTERAALWQRVEAATFLTLNEKRAAIGYGPVDGGDRLSNAAARP